MLASALMPLVAIPPAASAQVADSAKTAENEGFGIEDYFGIKTFTNLALSSDGAWLAYSTETLSLRENETVRRVTLLPLNKNTPVSPEALADARSLAWIPGTQELAFLSSRSGSVQLYSYGIKTGEVRQRTRSGNSVMSFRFAPDGRNFAYATRASSKAGTSLYDQFRTADAGILIDPASLSSHDFVNPDWNAMVDPEPATLWIMRPGDTATRIPVSGEARGYDDTYFWSSDSSAMSVNFVDNDIRSSQLSDDRISIGIFELGSREFRPLAKAFSPSGGRFGISYSGGEWIPNERRVVVRRMIERDVWVSDSFPDWTIVDAAGKLPAAASWHPVELYPRGLRFQPTNASQIFVENTVEGEHSLFILKPGGLERSAIVAGLDGSSGQFEFSADLRTVVFVNESLTSPPEIFVRSGDTSARKLTRLNDDIARQVDFRAREVSWKSGDGLTIKGWLLEPKGGRPGQPRPLITHVHGGPAFPFPNAFVPYFSYWPYPLEVYASRGMAVFLPNYRGTHTYGRRIAAAKGDGQAIGDIISGVRALVDAGVADPDRLAISGHSHGALIGPLAMAQSKMFRASSFGEGASNQVVMYELMSGDANREIHDSTIGVSLYDSPQTYIKGSADLQLQGVTTASLFEAGAKTSAIFMLGLAKAANRFRMPSDFIIYPKTAHNLDIPTLQQESAERNLDWFSFWLKGCEDFDPAKVGQYRRWRKMKSETKAANSKSKIIGHLLGSETADNLQSESVRC